MFGLKPIYQPLMKLFRPETPKHIEVNDNETLKTYTLDQFMLKFRQADDKNWLMRHAVVADTDPTMGGTISTDAFTAIINGRNVGYLHEVLDTGIELPEAHAKFLEERNNKEETKDKKETKELALEKMWQAHLEQQNTKSAQKRYLGLASVATAIVGAVTFLRHKSWVQTALHGITKFAENAPVVSGILAGVTLGGLAYELLTTNIAASTADLLYNSLAISGIEKLSNAGGYIATALSSPIAAGALFVAASVTGIAKSINDYFHTKAMLNDLNNDANDLKAVKTCQAHLKASKGMMKINLASAAATIAIMTFWCFPAVIGASAAATLGAIGVSAIAIGAMAVTAGIKKFFTRRADKNLKQELSKIDAGFKPDAGVTIEELSDNECNLNDGEFVSLSRAHSPSLLCSNSMDSIEDGLRLGSISRNSSANSSSSSLGLESPIPFIVSREGSLSSESSPAGPSRASTPHEIDDVNLMSTARIGSSLGKPQRLANVALSFEAIGEQSSEEVRQAQITKTREAAQQAYSRDDSEVSYGHAQEEQHDMARPSFI